MFDSEYDTYRYAVDVATHRHQESCYQVCVPMGQQFGHSRLVSWSHKFCNKLSAAVTVSDAFRVKYMLWLQKMTFNNTSSSETDNPC